MEPINKMSIVDSFIDKYRASRYSADFSEHYYNQLTEGQKSIYRSIAAGMLAFSDKISIPLRPINELSIIFNYILLDNPLLFYVSGIGSQNDLYKKRSIVTPEYAYERTWAKEKISAAMGFLRVFDGIRGKSDYEKELYVHDYCLNHFKYDYAFDELSHTILGPMLGSVGVCEGIAKFVKLALDHLGVRSIVVSGKAKNPYDDSENEYHAWNIVHIEGRTYHLDVTFDMTVKRKTNRHDYFNLPDDEIKKDHTIISYVPTCTTDRRDYYSMNQMLAQSPSDVEKQIRNNLAKGRKDIVIKLINTEYSKKVIDRILNIAQKEYSMINKRSGAIGLSCNRNQLVFEINFR